MSRLVLGLELISGSGWTGGGIYIRNVVATLATLPSDQQPEVRLIGAVDPDDPAVRELRSYPFVDSDSKFRRRPALTSRLLRTLGRRLLGGRVPFDPLYAGIDATFPTFGMPIKGAAPIHWMPDFQHRYLPHMFTTDEVVKRDAGLAALAKKRVTLVLSSAAALAVFERFCPGALPDIRVWRFVSRPVAAVDFDPRPKYDLPARYLYLPNQLWAHKNHLAAFKALRRLVEAGHDLTLVCTGLAEDHRNPEHPARLASFVSDAELGRRVRMLGLIPREEQIAIFQHATLVIQPSLFEGWSTVVEDAKSLGRPIVASDIAVHREQLTTQSSVGRFAFFPAEDDEQLADAIARLWGELPTGPDPVAEARAAALGESRQLEAAHEFMDILRCAVDGYRGTGAIA